MNNQLCLSARHLLAGAALAMTLAACGGSDNNRNSSSSNQAESEHMFDIRIQNLSAAQPFSPVALALTDGSYAPWVIGEPSSLGLEHLAEGGDNSAFLSHALASSDSAVGINGAELILPGGSVTYTLSAKPEALHLNLASMLVNTNDAFTGVNAVDLSGMAVGAEWRANLPVYDAGTETNSEHAGTIPGPADAGGEGFNAERMDVNFVARHSGTVTQTDDQTSVLKENHRFDAPIGKVTVVRVR